MKKTILSLIIFTIITTACNQTKNINAKTILINSKTVPCTGVFETTCMQVKWTKDQKDWQYFYGEIEGFTYESGYEYELIVKTEKIENPPADGSSIRYILVKEISKKKI